MLQLRLDTFNDEDPDVPESQKVKDVALKFMREIAEEYMDGKIDDLEAARNKRLEQLGKLVPKASTLRKTDETVIKKRPSRNEKDPGDTGTNNDNGKADGTGIAQGAPIKKNRTTKQTTGLLNMGQPPLSLLEFMASDED